MKCEKCGREIKEGEKYFTAIGVIQCEECDIKSGHSVGLDFIFNKIKESEKR